MWQIFDQIGRHILYQDPEVLIQRKFQLSLQPYSFLGWFDTRKKAFVGQTDRTADCVGIFLSKSEIQWIYLVYIVENQSVHSLQKWYTGLENHISFHNRLEPFFKEQFTEEIARLVAEWQKREAEKNTELLLETEERIEESSDKSTERNQSSTNVSSTAKNISSFQKPKFSFRVISLILQLLERCPIERLELRDEDEETVISYQSGLIDLPAILATDLLDQIEKVPLSWGWLYWVGFCKDFFQEETVKRWFGLVESKMEDKIRKSDVINIVRIIAEYKKEQKMIDTVVEKFEWTESEIVNDWLRRGLKEGEAQGVALGEARGEARGKQDLLIKLIEKRYKGSITDELSDLIRKETDPERLDRWSLLTLELSTMQELQNQIMASSSSNHQEDAKGDFSTNGNNSH